jgi:hypothetical protein
MTAHTANYSFEVRFVPQADITAEAQFMRRTAGGVHESSMIAVS